MLTGRDQEILEALARCVHVLSLPQIARTWWQDSADGERAARARLRLLVREQLLSVQQVLAHPELPLREPVVCWRPGEQEPDPGQVAYRLQARWRRELSPTTVATLAADAAHTFGGYPAPPLRTDEITHDIHLAAVYLRYRARTNAPVPGWIGERVLRSRRERGQKGAIPDAMIRASSSIRAIEFGGAYSKRRVQSFHDHCSAQGLAYELW